MVKMSHFCHTFVTFVMVCHAHFMSQTHPRSQLDFGSFLEYLIWKLVLFGVLNLDLVLSWST